MALSRTSSTKSEWKYHVFLSFRGDDTRLNFADHLYKALCQKGIITFRDNEELKRGEVICEELPCAIKESLFAIVVISQNYASSTWCLDELQKIVETKSSLGRVFPVFYGVDPSHVRHQKGSLEESFKRHEENFVGDQERVKKWRKALEVVACLAGWDAKGKYETILIEEIVAEVWKKVEPELPTINDGLVAIDSKVDDMYSHLRLESKDVCFIGIWGMGGIGKTTLAEVVLQKIQNQFDVSCFLSNVREAAKDGDQGLVSLQNKLLSHLNLKSMSMIIETSNQGKEKIKNCLHKKKVLLVLDDVSDKRQLENLAGNQEWFGPGSRIIVTTRDRHLLKSHRVLFEMYEIRSLNTNESFQLFCEKAFKGTQPKDYLELSKNVVEYTGGLPLALEVLGHLLCGKSVQEWRDTLSKISKTPLNDIMSIIKISFDMLEEEYKTIFLDIACFFKGWYKDKVIKILDHCGFHPIIGVNVLIEKSLISCNKGVLWMHDMVEEMGKTIASQEYLDDPGKRSRLWSQEDIDKVLRTNMGAEKVQRVVLKQQIESHKELWHPGAFSMMCNLKLLIMLCDLPLLHSLECLPTSLKVLIWMEYPFEDLPPGVKLDELVYLQMGNSKLEKLWNGSQFFEKLKVIDLSYSHYLIQTPNISCAPNLEELFLDGCVSLVEVHQSVGQHKKLEALSLIGCTKLKTLPSKLEMSSLKRLFLCDCLNIRKLPNFGENMECLSVLNLMNCSNLCYLPNTISNLKSLKRLNLSGCSKVCTLPETISQNKALEDLDLSKTSIREVNSALFHLENLKRLSFHGCNGLVLPNSISGLSSLNIFDLSYCNLSVRSISEDIGHLSSLETLILSGNKDLVLPLSNIANLSKLRFLELEGCRSFVDGPVLRYLLDFNVEAGIFLNLWKFWKLFESHDCELLCQVRDPSYPVIYLETPPKFGNEIFFPMAQQLSKLESSASIMVDIPNKCGRAEWWGIVVFLAFEPSSQSIFDIELCWSFEASHPEAGRSLYLSSDAQAHYKSCLVTMIMSDNHIYIQLHHRRYPNISESKAFSKHRKPEFSENRRLRFDVRGGQQKIKECGYHVLCKEDFRSEALQKWQNRSFDKPNSKHSEEEEEENKLMEEEEE